MEGTYDSRQISTGGSALVYVVLDARKCHINYLSSAKQTVRHRSSQKTSKLCVLQWRSGKDAKMKNVLVSYG